jgi:DMSO/TMAO reductase YedYZ molybdopterin-dependent catalytic subunit
MDRIGPFRADFWRSPLRGPWLTALLGTILLGLLGVVVLTGFVSHVAYEPDLRENAIVPRDRDLPVPFGWPNGGPAWLYALNQGLHTNVGLVAIPFLLAKLWSVIPRLFAWPPVTSPAQAIERLSVALLVGSAGFQFATGVVNMQLFYPFRFNFVVAHYFGAIVFVAAVAVHVVVKLPVVARAYRERGLLRPLMDDLAHTNREPADEDGLVSPRPGAATVTRRGLLGFVGAGSLALLAANIGQSVGGQLRPLAFLAPRRQGFPVNHTFAGVGLREEAVREGYRLRLRGGARELAFSRAELLALPQATHALPIACVEGWTTTQTWTGVPLAELARIAGVPGASEVLVESLQEGGVLASTSLSADAIADERSLLALRVGGEDLSLDHGFPARIIAPALPGVHTTKWVGTMTFSGGVA